MVAKSGLPHRGFFHAFSGESLVHPLFSGTESFLDGLYTTLWGDGLCGGVATFAIRPPWNYDLVCIGYLFALIPTMLVLIGGIVVAWQLLRDWDSRQFLLVSLAFLVGIGIIYLNLSCTYFASVKAFYGLCALVPFCYFGAAGWEFVAQKIKALRFVILTFLVAWALNSFASLWIKANAPDTQALLGVSLAEDGNDAGAIKCFDAALRVAPDHVMARSWLLSALTAQGRFGAARQVAEGGVKANPFSAVAHLGMASALEHDGQLELALSHIRRAVAFRRTISMPIWNLRGGSSNFSVMTRPSPPPVTPSGSCQQTLNYI